MDALQKLAHFLIVVRRAQLTAKMAAMQLVRLATAVATAILGTTELLVKPLCLACYRRVKWQLDPFEKPSPAKTAETQRARRAIADATAILGTTDLHVKTLCPACYLKIKWQPDPFEKPSTASTAARQLVRRAIAVACVRPVSIERLLAGKIRARVM
jgi:hypothetical protein